jgi:HK97 family phage major capsid protein
MDAATQAAITASVEAALAPIKAALGKKTTENAPRPQNANSRERVARAFSKHGAGYDPHEGKGLNFTRWVLCLARAGGHQNVGRAAEIAEDLAKGIDDRDIKESYEKVAEGLSRTVQGSVQRALGESTLIDGGALTPDEFSSEFIELLRPATVVRRAGARVVPMSGGSLTMGRQNAPGTATYVGENTIVDATQQQYGQLQLQAKKLMAVTPISNDLIRDAVLSAEMLTRDDLVKVAAITEDQAFLRGTGTQFTPKGVRNWLQSANVFDTLQAGSIATAQEVLQSLDYLMQAPPENNVPLTSAAFFMRPRAKMFLATLRDSVGGFVFRGELQGKSPTLYGWPVYETTSIPNNLNQLGGSNESEVYFGEVPELLIGENTQLLVQIFPGGTYNDINGNLQSGISQDQTVITITLRHDFAMRHTASWAVLVENKWGV